VLTDVEELTPKQQTKQYKGLPQLLNGSAVLIKKIAQKQ